MAHTCTVLLVCILLGGLLHSGATVRLPYPASILKRAAAAAHGAVSFGHRKPPSANGAQFSDPGMEASLQLAARQNLFDYAVEESLKILKASVAHLTIPDYTTEIDVPVLGGIDVHLTSMKIKQLDMDESKVAVSIRSGFYHLEAADVTTTLGFDWSWSKGPLSGSGYGELQLTRGGLDMTFIVVTNSGAPEVRTVSTGVSFESLDLEIHSFSVDWMYQTLMYLFSGSVKQQIEDGIAGALRHDVPAAVNDMLSTLPAKISVRGLPFEMVFTYALYTLNYVIVKGYGQVDTVVPAATAGRSAVTAGSATARAGFLTQQQLQQVLRDSAECPFPATALSVTPNEIAGDVHMTTLYVHQNILNCVMWGLHNAGVLSVTVRDGDIKQLRLITDLFGGLMPELPQRYPGRSLQLDIGTSTAPQVSFNRSSNVTVTAQYITGITVLNATGDGANVAVADLLADLSINADVGWDSTKVGAVTANYHVRSSAVNVNVAGWNGVVPWVIRQAAPALTMRAIIEQYVQTPFTPYFALSKTKCTSYDEWFGVSTDVLLKQLPILGGRHDMRDRGVPAS